MAEAVVRQAREEGVGQDIADAEIPARVAAEMWETVYLPMVPAEAEKRSMAVSVA